MLRARALSTPDKIGVSYLDSESSWREVYVQAFTLGTRLRASGVGKGDVVAVYLPHCLGKVVAIFAVAMCDGIFTDINPQLAPDQVKHQVQDASVKAVVGSPELLAPMEEFFGTRQIHMEPISPLGLSAEEWVSDCDLSVPVATAIPADVSNYIYTSGSTGRAKGVVVPHRTLLDGARIVSGYLKIAPEDRILSILPFSFDYGLNQLMSCVYVGARITLLQFLLAKDLIDTLIGERITGLAVVPSVWPKLLKPALKKDRRFEHLRYVTTAGGFHPPQLLESISEFFPRTEVIVMYGLTESFRSTYLPFPQMRKRPGSIGKAVPEVEILVLDEHGERCKPGQKGELIHRGAFVTYGYLNNPDLNEHKFIRLSSDLRSCLPETAVRSGDQVSMDEDGYIYFHGRLDQQIKSSGYRISPDEVAQAVLATPGVSHAAVFGLPDDSLGEAVHVAYETYGGEPIEVGEIKRHAKESLALYAIPHHYHFYPKLPLNPNGKIDFGALKRNAQEGAAQTGSED
jgi:acyl-CoA synthetase (AMP-forming)/AMP-acid ligase II